MSAALRGRVEDSGKYALCGEIASGGMATVHLGRLCGAAGFSRPVAIKRLHPQYVRDPSMRATFIDEARIASRIRHPNVVPTLDVISGDQAGQAPRPFAGGEELLIVLEYVHGESLGRLARTMGELDQPVPLAIILAVMSNVLYGLHAAHEARGAHGEPLDIVHRDVSPQNIIVGVDGVARVLDFGIARAAVRLETTRVGVVKGKLAYMAPEQLGGGQATRQMDIYSAAVVLWELLAGRRLFVDAENKNVLLEKLLHGSVEAPSLFRGDVPPMLDAITLHGLERDPRRRFASARDMARALERSGLVAAPSVVGDWVEQIADEALKRREAMLAALDEGAGAVSTTMPVVRVSQLDVDELLRATLPAPVPRVGPTPDARPPGAPRAPAVRSGVSRVKRQRAAPAWIFIVMGIVLGFALGVAFSAGARIRLMRIVGVDAPSTGTGEPPVHLRK